MPKTSKTMMDETDWARVQTMTDEEIHQNALDDPDSQPMSDEFMRTAKKRVVRRRGGNETKITVVALDPDVAAHFCSLEGGCDAAINNVLREHMQKKLATG